MGGRSSNRIDLTGQRYGRLTAVSFSHMEGNHSVWLCKCDCGGASSVRLNNLRTGHTRSCGCFEIESRNSADNKVVKHRHCSEAKNGMRRTPTYMSWKCMWDRCTDPKNASYPNYGARGVKICDEWKEFLQFLLDMGERPEGHTIDRINPHGGYCPSNCRWADAKTQGANRRKSYVGT